MQAEIHLIAADEASECMLCILLNYNPYVILCKVIFMPLRLIHLNNSFFGFGPWLVKPNLPNQRHVNCFKVSVR